LATTNTGYGDRHLGRSPFFEEQTRRVPALLTPLAPSGEQNAPALTVARPDVVPDEVELDDVVPDDVAPPELTAVLDPSPSGIGCATGSLSFGQVARTSAMAWCSADVIQAPYFALTATCRAT
jgi:hypothetical protein